jgi:adenosylcobinamide kinase/adenosylcobinamide-phosphate guanylyltransferase
MAELILGGARSGKSALALRRATESRRTVVWIATAEAGDDEMVARIARHRAERPAHWRTVEETLHLADTLRRVASADSCVVVDCLTLWLTNLLLAEDAALLARETGALLDILPTLPGQIILVANEVGLGIVPENALARRFRDEAGRLNQAVAALCERVTFVAAGLPLVLK